MKSARKIVEEIANEIITQDGKILLPKENENELYNCSTLSHTRTFYDCSMARFNCWIDLRGLNVSFGNIGNTVVPLFLHRNRRLERVYEMRITEGKIAAVIEEYGKFTNKQVSKGRLNPLLKRHGVLAAEIVAYAKKDFENGIRWALKIMRDEK